MSEKTDINAEGHRSEDERLTPPEFGGEKKSLQGAAEQGIAATDE